MADSTDPDRLDEFIASDRDRALCGLGLPPDAPTRPHKLPPPAQAPTEPTLAVIHDRTGNPARALQWPPDPQHWPPCVIIRIDGDGPDSNRAAVKVGASTERILLVNTNAPHLSKWHRFLADAGYTFESPAGSDDLHE